MRRKDKEIKDKKEIESIINRCDICRIALCDNNSPYIVPVCFGYSENYLYFHSAREGKKIDIIKKNNNVCFEFDIYDGPIESESPCNWDMKYYSVIGSGEAFFIDDFQEKTKALYIITEHYSGNSSEFQKDSVDNVTVIKVEIKNIMGKRSGHG